MSEWILRKDTAAVKHKKANKGEMQPLQNLTYFVFFFSDWFVVFFPSE